MPVGIRGSQPRRGGGDGRAASASESPCGGSEDGALRSGTESSVPWLVSVEAVATSASQYAAARRRSSQPAGTTTSELRITTSAGAHAREGVVHVAHEARVDRLARVGELQVRGLLGDAAREREDAGVGAGVVGDQHRAGLGVVGDRAQALLEQRARLEDGDADDDVAARGAERLARGQDAQTHGARG